MRIPIVGTRSGPRRGEALAWLPNLATIYQEDLAMTLQIDQLGRVVIPKRLRDRLGLAPGTRLLVEERSDGLYLSPVHESGGLVERDGFLVATGEVDDPDALIDAVERGRRERDRAVWG